ncbi:MAG: hypothetical protein ACLTPG_04805 [Mediterraneibacter gnavus]
MNLKSQYEGMRCKQAHEESTSILWRRLVRAHRAEYESRIKCGGCGSRKDHRECP